MRCLSLADEISRRGGEAIFICRELPGNLCNLIEVRGYRVLRLPAGVGLQQGGRVLEGDERLITAWESDAQQTAAVLAEFCSVDWLVVDHYGLDARWESSLRKIVRAVMVIDDLFDRPHDADLLLNQNVLPGVPGSYANLVPAACRVLLGPRYALLQGCYRELHKRIPLRSGRIERVLVYFGGVDAENLTGRSIQALLEVKCHDVVVDVVLPVSGPHKETVRDLARHLPRARIHESLPSLAQLIGAADLAIGAGGATSWERLCLGLPSVVVTLSENQRMIARGLQENELALWLGHHDEVTVCNLADELRRLLVQDFTPDWSARCRAAVDGFGAARVANVLLPENDLCMRPVQLADADLIYAWRNNPVTWRYFFDPRSITPSEHHAWYAKLLSDPDCVMLIGDELGRPVGAIRFDITGDQADISVYLAPEERGRGLGHRLIQAGSCWLFARRPAVRCLNARIHPENIASHAAFKRAGFIEFSRHYRFEADSGARG